MCLAYSITVEWLIIFASPALEWTMRRCVEALIPTSDQGAVPPWGCYKIFCLFNSFSAFTYFWAEILQTNIWKPFVVKFNPQTNRNIIDLHKEHFALIKRIVGGFSSHLSFVQFHSNHDPFLANTWWGDLNIVSKWQLAIYTYTQIANHTL